MSTGGDPDGRPGGDGSRLRLQDEVLQVMFWMRGEDLGEEVRPGQLEVFLTPEEGRDLEPAFRRLVDRGLLERDGSGGAPTYRLTEDGLLEGGRRFADEFAEIAGQAHGTCSDPDCACQSDPEAAHECREERHEHA